MAIETDLCSQTNWTILSGSLINCLTFQTSLSFSDDDDDEESTTTSTSTSTSKPLLLHSPSLYPSPCEITINFAEKHEVRQIYVRSTARVYEVYSAHDSQSNNEYLCTVRCGVATRDGEVLCAPNFHEIASLGYKDSGDENAKSEDDWVEVKIIDDPSIDSNTIDQDFFEATAVIDDMNPCISITLRLLSLQRRGYVCVDEIYVFGDPVESENQESHNENTSGSSLMAMFLPTLMQMSKTTGLSHLNAVRKENQFVMEDNLKETPHPSGSITENQLKGKASIMDPHQEKLKEIKGEQPESSNGNTKMQSDRASVPPQVTQMDSNCSAIPSKIAEIENNHCAVPSQVAINQGDFSGGNVERALEKLMSRMDRIEEICLGFQEKMVMPMSSIEIRLQRVEQQLDTLSKKFQNPALPSGYRISAPDVSCIESDANSCENCVDYTDTREVESDKKYSHAEELNVALDISDSENTTKLLPGLVVTAPEFPEGEDEEDNASEQTMTSNHKGKQSIDDALSSAFANFVFSLSLESAKSKCISVIAPEFSDEDDDDHESNNGTLNTDAVHFTDSEQDEVCVNASILPEHNLKTDVKDNVEEENGKISGQCQNSDASASNTNNISNELVVNQIPGGCGIPQDGPSARTEHTVATEAPIKPFGDNIIDNVLGFPVASPVIDFEIPVLDVKFISQRSPMKMSYLDALLVEKPDTSPRDSSVMESSENFSVKEQLKGNGDLSVEEHSNLISVDNGEPVYLASSSSFDLDGVLCSFISAPVNIEGDDLAEDQKCKHDEISTSSLI